MACSFFFWVHFYFILFILFPQAHGGPAWHRLGGTQYGTAHIRNQHGATAGLEMCFATGSRHLECWGSKPKHDSNLAYRFLNGIPFYLPHFIYDRISLQGTQQVIGRLIMDHGGTHTRCTRMLKSYSGCFKS